MRLSLYLFLVVLAPGSSLSGQPAEATGYAAKADSIIRSYAGDGLYRGAIVAVQP